MNSIVFVRDVDEENEDIFYIFFVNINTLSLISPKTKQIVGKLKSMNGNQVSSFNENYGYFSKGYEPVGGYASNTERMEFANDTLLTVPSGKTSVLESYGVAATQNSQ